MQTANRVAFNTGIMYSKVVITVFINLYATRLILQELGESDFGIFNLIAGILAMLAFLSLALSISVRRYLSTALGKNDICYLHRIFKSSLVIHRIAGIIVVLIFEAAGIYLFGGILNIPETRLTSAHIVYHCMVVSTFFSITTIPYNSLIISHENIAVIALCYIFESFAKLGAAFLLLCTPHDKLVVYGITIASIYTTSTFIKRIYCRKKYEEVKLEIKGAADKSLMRELIKFSCWNSLSTISKVLSAQGIIFILNIFGGTIVNAAYGIANQVRGQMMYFSTSLLQTIEPQIMKSEGAGNTLRMLKLSMLSCKMAFFLMSFFSIPLMIQLPYILKLWLGNPPDYTVIFCRTIIIATLVSQLTLGLESGIQAVGKIRRYQIIVGSIQIMVLPLSYFFLKAGYSIYAAVYCILGIEISLSITRMIMSSRLLQLKQSIFIRHAVLPSVLLFIATYWLTQTIVESMPLSFATLLTTIIISSVLSLIFFRYILLNQEEIQKITAMCKTLYDRIISKTSRIKSK